MSEPFVCCLLPASQFRLVVFWPYLSVSSYVFLSDVSLCVFGKLVLMNLYSMEISLDDFLAGLLFLYVLTAGQCHFNCSLFNIFSILRTCASFLIKFKKRVMEVTKILISYYTIAKSYEKPYKFAVNETISSKYHR